MMNEHRSQNFVPFGYSEMWTSFINHDFVDNHDQPQRIPSSDRPPTPSSTQDSSSYTPSLHSDEDTPCLSFASKDALVSSERAMFPFNTSRSSTPSHRRYGERGPEDAVVVADRNTRRRQQNRNSQRAFRCRKEAHQKDLENQIGSLKQKHAKLFDSLISQCEIISKLRTTMSALSAQAVSLQTEMCHALSLVDSSQYDSDSSRNRVGKKLI